MVVFILDVMVIISISSMEYRMHSMEISIKKILGYGVIERNKRIILYNLFADLIVIVVMCILGVTAKIISLKICIPIGIFIIIVEMFVLACNIIKVENENTYKVLKGGCL